MENDDATYVIQMMDNNVHLNVQASQLSLNPTNLFTAGDQVEIQKCYHRYGTVHGRASDGRYIIVHDPIPEDDPFMKANPSLDRVHVLGGSDIFIDLNVTASPHSLVEPSKMFELYFDPHFLLGDRVIVTMNNVQQEGIITDMDFETNRYSIHFFNSISPSYGIPYEEISYS